MKVLHDADDGHLSSASFDNSSNGILQSERPDKGLVDDVIGRVLILGQGCPVEKPAGKKWYLVNLQEIFVGVHLVTLCLSLLSVIADNGKTRR